MQRRVGVEVALPATGQVLDAVRVQPVGLHEPRRGLAGRERGEERTWFGPNRLHDLLLRADALREHLAECRVVLAEHVLDARVVPDGVRELAAHELQVGERLVRHGELEVRVAELVDGVHEREVGEPAELVHHDAEGSLVPAFAEYLAHGPLLLDVHEEDLAERGRLDLEEVGGELDVEEQVLLEHVADDDVGRVGVHERRLELVHRPDESREHLVDLVPQAVDLRHNLARRLLVERAVEAVLERALPRLVAVADGLQAQRNVAHREGQALAFGVHHPVQEPAQVREHELGLGVVVVVVAERQDGEDALRNRHRVAPIPVRRAGVDPDHVVGVAGDGRLIPGRQGEDPQVALAAGVLGDSLDGADLLVAPLPRDDDAALSVEHVLQHLRPEHAHRLPGAGLPEDVPVRRALPLVEVDGRPPPAEERPARSEADEGGALGSPGDLLHEVDRPERESSVVRLEVGAREASDDVVPPEDDGGPVGEEHGQGGDHADGGGERGVPGHPGADGGVANERGLDERPARGPSRLGLDHGRPEVGELEREHQAAQHGDEPGEKGSGGSGSSVHRMTSSAVERLAK